MQSIKKKKCIKKGTREKIKCFFTHAREYTKERYCLAKERSKPELDEKQ
jgi:hypothetical protein